MTTVNEFKSGDKALCIYGHYEAEVVTVKGTRPGTYNIRPIIYVCEASDGEELTLSPLDLIKQEDL